VAVVLYGLALRPLFSNETLRDETITIMPGQMMSFDMRLLSTSKRELILEYEVLPGNPINVLVAEMGSTQEGAKNLIFVPAFSSQSTLAGKKKGLLPKGMWSVLLISPANVIGPTKIKVKTQLQRPKFFTGVSKPV
jgi:hypothetical protein